VELIRAEGGFEALPKEITDEIVHCYFRHVHFLLPVVDACNFLNEYQNNGLEKVNPLLMWSMFLAAANVSPYVLFIIYSEFRAAGFLICASLISHIDWATHSPSHSHNGVANRCIM
jgi:hypothetical protein